MNLGRKITLMSVLLGIFTLFLAWQVCLPDGCFFMPKAQICQDGNCVNEDVGDHFKERSVFLLATVNNNQNLAQALILFFVFIVLIGCKPQLLQLNLKFKSVIRNYALVHNKLINLFAKGVLHPKIY